MFIKNNLIKPLQIKPKTRIKYPGDHIAYPATQMYLFWAYLISLSRTWMKRSLQNLLEDQEGEGLRETHRNSLVPCREDMTLYSPR